MASQHWEVGDYGGAFVGKQPGSVKACMRLLKWWRDQQTFSCDLTRPSDELLESATLARLDT